MMFFINFGYSQCNKGFFFYIFVRSQYMFGQGTMGASESGVPRGPWEHPIHSCAKTGLGYKKLPMEFDFK